MRSAEISQLLVAWGRGDRAAFEALTPLILPHLRRLAAGHLAGERPGHVLQATALVNEAYLRLIEGPATEWQGRAHFFGVAAQIMRHILVDIARARGRVKRGGGELHVSLSDAAGLTVVRSADLVALDDALKRLEAFDARKSRVIEMRFFGGLGHQEIADVLQVSVGTVRRDWTLARAWLHREMRR